MQLKNAAVRTQKQSQGCFFELFLIDLDDLLCVLHKSFGRLLKETSISTFYGEIAFDVNNQNTGPFTIVQHDERLQLRIVTANESMTKEKRACVVDERCIGGCLDSGKCKSGASQWKIGLPWCMHDMVVEFNGLTIN